MGKFRYLFTFCLAFVVSGCSHNMALTKGQTNIVLSTNSIALLSVKIFNQNKPGRQLDLAGFIICPQSKTCTDGAVNLYKADDLYKSEKDLFNEYLLSFELESGTYNIKSIIAVYSVPLLVSAGGGASLDLKAEIKPKSVIYLGHIDAILRERKNDNEERAGLFPLIDSAIAGFSSGTFDVVVEDRFEEDMKGFNSEYPALQSVQIEKSILPQWIRPENRGTK